MSWGALFAFSCYWLRDRSSYVSRVSTKLVRARLANGTREQTAKRLRVMLLFGVVMGAFVLVIGAYGLTTALP